MRFVGLVLVALIAAIHVYIAYFEIFAWETRGPEVFPVLPADLFTPTVAMAANQGLYNAFLAAGLIWALLIGDRKWQLNVATIFLLFVFAAGVFGAATVSGRILFVQAVPSAIALILLWIGRTRDQV
ncbi:putative membrane protein [Cognatiyoonia koreensis]|uniref:Putative membrane protein n=1 Tax=Cognatiyoonia koreensis TaxID=364200 RepID=A0A1I0RZB7_9RHOB|nr:DUF1304 domain-containing protein [Cognatiyoonia koreensis]SEW47124.1 putative membrane protein [Cognatiyoonia koreensis]